jgi:ribonuclease BN (tRNA processing enzyme)
MKRRPFLGALAAAALPLRQVGTTPPGQSPTARVPTKITLLGTGTPHPSLERQSSSYLVETGGDTILLDHGTGSHHRLLESGHKAVDVTHAFFTHLHYDHCMDYARLVLQRWDQGADLIPDLDVYGPVPMRRMTDLLFGPDGVYGPDIRARIEHQSSIDTFAARGGTPPRNRPAPRVREIKSGDVVEGKSWKLTVGHAVHVQPYLECLAFRLDAEDGSLCYSGDSAAADSIVELAKGCDMLIHMNHAFTGTAPTPAFRDAVGHHKGNARTAQRAGVKTLVLVHAVPSIDQPRIREQIIHEIQQEFSGRVIWGEDLMQLTFAAPVITTSGY